MAVAIGSLGTLCQLMLKGFAQDEFLRNFAQPFEVEVAIVFFFCKENVEQNSLLNKLIGIFPDFEYLYDKKSLKHFCLV
jgi:hypothetical protein